MSASPTREQLRAIAAVASAIIEAVRAAGSTGAPGGVIYAALMGQGCSLSQYESLMEALVRTDKLRRSGDLYFIEEAKR
jgi:hypothetical protein